MNELEYLPGGESLATWWVQATPGSGYWRCKVPAKALPGRVLWMQHEDFHVNGDNVFFPAHVGPAIWQFPGTTARALAIAGMQADGVKTFVEVDDNYTKAPPRLPGHVAEWRKSFDPREVDASSYEVHTKVCKFADGIICATEPLADVYRQINPNVHVCPNSIDPADWPEPEKPDDGILRIGYAYSSSHYFDMVLIAEALDWASKQKDVEVWMIGPDEVHPLIGRIQKLHHMPWADDLAQYRKNLQILDVGLCPLMPGPWANCKSDIKAMEYAMAGAFPLPSVAIPYDQWGWGCVDGKDFLRATKMLVKKRDEVRAWAEEAKQEVLAERTIDKSIHLWEEALAS